MKYLDDIRPFFVLIISDFIDLPVVFNKSILFFQYFNRTGQLRPTTGPARKDGSKAGGTQKYNALLKNSGKPPKGMYINHDDLVSLATGPSSQGEQLLKSMDREIVTYKRTVSLSKDLERIGRKTQNCP